MGSDVVLDDPTNSAVRNARFAYVDGCHPAVVRDLRLRGRGAAWGVREGGESKSEMDANLNIRLTSELSCLHVCPELKS